MLVIFQLDVVAQIARQVKNQLARGVRIKANGRGDSVSALKHEMGIDFTLQRAQFCLICHLAQLFRPRNLKLGGDYLRQADGISCSVEVI